MNFRRFLAEAISTLDFKTQEEPMMIIVLLNAALAVSGLQVLHLLEKDMEGGKGLMSGIEGASVSGSPSKGGEMPGELRRSLFHLRNVYMLTQCHTYRVTAATSSVSKDPVASVVRQSVICGISLLLRDHLKHLYSIT